MRVCIRWVAVCSVLVASGAGSTEALAQGTYVSAALIGDIVRSSHTEAPGLPESSGGEALGFALRIGTPLGSIWGVEAEFARPAEIEHDIDVGSLAYWSSLDLVSRGLDTIPSLPGVMRTGATSLVLPPIRSFGSSAERTTTTSASVWVQQQLSGRVAMVYIAGMGFYRSEYRSRLTDGPLIADVPGLTLPAFDTTTVTYGVRPLAGLESRITMTDHVQLVPGLRLHGANGGWLIRPSVGLAWTF